MNRPFELDPACKVCSRRWISTRRVVVAGVWQTCPPCRTDPLALAPTGTESDAPGPDATA